MSEVATILFILFAFIFVLLIIIIFRKIFIAKSTLGKTSAKKNIIKKPDSKARTNDTLRSELKKYEIFTLGTSGSGKTCFLASMFNSLVVYKKEYGFSLKVPDRQQEKKLIDIYSTIKQANTDWPAGTIKEKKWDFIVSTYGDRQYPLFEFTYLDYAGGKITDNISDEGLFGIKNHTNKADSIIVLLDGQKIHNQLEKLSFDIPTQVSIFHDLEHLTPLLVDVFKTPVHFLITKWDLLSDNYSLSEIRDLLYKHPNFKAVIEHRKTVGTPTRLIPVSSVGNGFAELCKNGTMKKNANVYPEPYQVEMPIACAVIDPVRNVLGQLNDKNILKLRQITETKSLMSRKTLAAVRGLSEALFHVFPAPYQWMPGSIVGLIKYIEKDNEEKYEQLKSDLDDSISNIHDEKTAFKSVLLSHQALISRLEKEHPESKLV